MVLAGAASRRFIARLGRDAHHLDPAGGAATLESLLAIARVNPPGRRELASRLARAGHLPVDLLTFLYVRGRLGQGLPAMLVTALSDPTAIPRAVRMARAQNIQIPEMMPQGNIDPSPLIRRLACALSYDRTLAEPAASRTPAHAVDTTAPCGAGSPPWIHTSNNRYHPMSSKPCWRKPYNGRSPQNG